MATIEERPDMAGRNGIPADPFARTPKQLTIPLIAGGLPDVDRWQHVLDNTRVASDTELADFVDAAAHRVHIARPVDPITRKEKPGEEPLKGPEYMQVLWAAAVGDLLLSADGSTLMARVVDRSGRNVVLDQWRGLGQVEDFAGGGIDRKKYVRGMDATIRVMLQDVRLRVQHGIKFADGEKDPAGVAFLRDENGKIIRIHPGDPLWGQPFELTVPTGWDEKLKDEAIAFARWAAADEHSAQNLIRFFATPVLEPYKHLSYVWYGTGGDGKGLISGSLSGWPVLKDLVARIDVTSLTSTQNGQMEHSNAVASLSGKLWAIDDDADAIGSENLTGIKKISTGDPLLSRLIGQNAVTVLPRCTFLMATNNPAALPSINAFKRRMVLSRLKGGRTEGEFAPLKAFIDQHHAAPFLMASAEIWERKDSPWQDVQIGDIRNADELQLWIIDGIVDKGYALAGDACPIRANRKAQQDAMAVLGVANKPTRIPNADGHGTHVQRCFVVVDEAKFGPFRRAALQQLADAAVGVPLPDNPLSTDRAQLALRQWGFDCDFVSAGDDKVARNWQRKVEDPSIDTTTVPENGPFAVVPGPDCIVLDLDRSKHEGQPDGWDLINDEAGQWQSRAFPETLLVRTPSGGAHVYYRVPEKLRGKIKNGAHLRRADIPGGIPVDVRVARKGYVMGPTSVVKAGTYQVVALPPVGADGERHIPELSPELCEWLQKNGYTETDKEMPSTQNDNAPQWHPSPATNGSARGAISRWNIDMSPIPEGARNDTLFRWGCGLLGNHPSEREEVEARLFARGRSSGLGDREIHQIWRSVQHQVSA